MTNPLFLRRWLFLVLAWSLMAAAIRADSVVARIDGHPLTADEFRLFVGWHKATVARRVFAGEPVVSAPMWTQSRAGVVPADVLREEALHDALVTKARQILFQERGLTTHVTFAEIEAEFTAENKRRALAAAAGAVIYGPRQWTLETYYLNRDSELTTKLEGQVRAEKPAGADAPSGDAIRSEVETLVKDRFARAKVDIDREAVSSVAVP